MGTRFEILLPGEDSVRLQAAAEEALNEIERVEAQLSMYRLESDLSGINAYAAAGPVRVEPRLFALLRLAVLVSRATGGAFDPTVAPLLHCWGFVGGTGKLPDQGELEAARSMTGADLLELEEEAFTVRFLREGVRLDLGAIGKGYGIDRAVETLEDAGIERALIHAGTSTVYGMDAPASAEAEDAGWPVALRDPRRGPGETMGEVRLSNLALSVSAPHGKAFREGDRLYGHVLDPRTGEPTRGALLAAVGHPSATLTDALSTALLVLGPAGLPLLQTQCPEADFLVVVERDDRTETHAAGPNAWRLQVDAESAGTEPILVPPAAPIAGPPS